MILMDDLVGHPRSAIDEEDLQGFGKYRPIQIRKNYV